MKVEDRWRSPSRLRVGTGLFNGKINFIYSLAVVKKKVDENGRTYGGKSVKIEDR